MEPYWYLASYPKSGNTWCRVFIAMLLRLAGMEREAGTKATEAQEQELRLNRDLVTGSIVSSRYWLDDQLGIDTSDLRTDELERVRGRVGHQLALYSEGTRYHKVHDAFFTPSSGQPVVCTEGCAGVVYVMRHPGDVAVSMSHFYGWDLERSVALLLSRETSMGKSNKSGGDQVRQYLGRWDNHVASWCEQTLLPVLILRYEDLLVDPEAYFQRLASFLGLPDKPELISEAVANTSFEKLRAKEEAEGGFHERQPGCERFFRSGKSGEGRKRLSDEQFHLLETSFSDTIEKYGYLS
jgi:hypothetical protein